MESYVRCRRCLDQYSKVSSINSSRLKAYADLSTVYLTTLTLVHLRTSKLPTYTRTTERNTPSVSERRWRRAGKTERPNSKRTENGMPTSTCPARYRSGCSNNESALQPKAASILCKWRLGCEEFQLTKLHSRRCKRPGSPGNVSL